MRTHVPHSHSTAPPRGTAVHSQDSGFTLVEVMIALSLLVLMLIPFANAYITSTTTTNNTHETEVAAMLASTALDKARAIDATDQGGSLLVHGRDQTSVAAQWTGTLPPGVDLSQTNEAYDSTAASGSGATAALPTSPTTSTISGHTYTTYYFVGTCYYQAAGTCLASPTTSTPLYRVIVDVTWSAPLSGCGTSGCHYVTSTLVSGQGDPTFNLNGTTPTTAPTTTSPSTTTTTTSPSTTSPSTTTTTTTPSTTTTTTAPTTTATTTAQTGVNCNPGDLNNPLDRWHWNASSNTPSSSADAPGNAIDGNMSTRFSSDASQAIAFTFTLNLHWAQYFNGLEMQVPNSPTDYARGYAVQVSSNGSSWTTVATCTGSSSDETVTFPGQDAQYVRVMLTAVDTTWWWSIDEINLYDNGN